MGRLLGVVGKPPLPTRECLMAFASLGDSGYRDGWGISGFHNERAVYFGRSQGAMAEERALFEKAVQKAESSTTPILVAHLRQSRDGTHEMNSTHPFHHRDWVFAHDGSIDKTADLTLVDTAPQGQTDSERFLHWALEQVIPEMDPTQALIAAIRDLSSKTRFTSLNFVLAHGKTLWAYHDSTEPQATLSWAPLSTGGGVVCSEKLRLAYPWQEVPQKTLLVLSPTLPPATHRL